MRHEVEVDTKLAELHGRLAKVYANADANKLTLARFAGAEPVYETRTRRVVRESVEELVTSVQELLDTERIPRYDQERARQAIQRHHDLLAERAAIREEMKPLDDEFDANPWSRFFLVTSSAGGHIHRSTSCSTTRIRTGFAWLPDLSGLTEKDAVAAHGPLLCTVCYPSAPVEWTVGIAKDESDKCPGSGERVANPNSRRYLRCPHCGESVSVTSTGKLRSHKKAKVKA